ncbi:hypothetical protein ACIBU0_35635 [Streptomyces sp. NPDC049627]|uniref:hypothetical protein n=1 Tax=Streptomyces sp. NPDC049627 TaxID=3365595 RepID=UPI003787C5B6
MSGETTLLEFFNSGRAVVGMQLLQQFEPNLTLPVRGCPTRERTGRRCRWTARANADFTPWLDGIIQAVAVVQALAVVVAIFV